MKKIQNPWIPLLDEGYNCFACAPTNPKGLKMEFWEDGEELVSLWRPTPDYEGWLGTLHGGVQSTLIDEIGGWWIGRKKQLSAMTTNLRVKFLKPVSSQPEDEIELRCRMKEQKRAFIIMEVTLKQGGEVRTEGELTYYCFSREVSDTQFRFQPFLLEEECEETKA